MAKVRIATRTGHRDPAHSVAVVFGHLHIFLGDGRPEAGPSCAGFEFGIGIEQRRSAAGAAKNSFIVQVPIFPGKGAFRPVMTGDLKGLRGELLLPLVVALTTFGRVAVSWRSPESENFTIVTSSTVALMPAWVSGAPVFLIRKV
jgi:hypothetical protein